MLLYREMGRRRCCVRTSGAAGACETKAAVSVGAVPMLASLNQVLAHSSCLTRVSRWYPWGKALTDPHPQYTRLGSRMGRSRLASSVQLLPTARCPTSCHSPRRPRARLASQIYVNGGNHVTSRVTTFPFGLMHQESYPWNASHPPCRNVKIGNDVWIGELSARSESD